MEAILGATFADFGLTDPCRFGEAEGCMVQLEAIMPTTHHNGYKRTTEGYVLNYSFQINQLSHKDRMSC